VLNRIRETKYLFNAAPLCLLSDRPGTNGDEDAREAVVPLRRRKTD
jgi:hypothetical protein